MFEEEPPHQQWSDLAQDLLEIWTQNSIHGPSDHTAKIRSLLKGETLTAFESALLDARTEHMDINKEEPPAATADDIKKALSDITSSTFPHRALDPTPEDDERQEKTV